MVELWPECFNCSCLYTKCLITTCSYFSCFYDLKLYHSLRHTSGGAKPFSGEGKLSPLPPPLNKKLAHGTHTILFIIVHKHMHNCGAYIFTHLYVQSRKRWNQPLSTHHVTTHTSAECVWMSTLSPLLHKAVVAMTVVVKVTSFHDFDFNELSPVSNCWTVYRWGILKHPATPPPKRKWPPLVL